jgi:hypothetical protein
VALGGGGGGVGGGGCILTIEELCSISIDEASLGCIMFSI